MGAVRGSRGFRKELPQESIDRAWRRVEALEIKIRNLRRLVEESTEIVRARLSHTWRDEEIFNALDRMSKAFREG